MLVPKLGLESAQFGTPNGINGSGAVSHFELGKILSIAALSGMDLIDTSHIYGTALKCLGRYSQLIQKRNFRIVLKIPKIDGRINFSAIQKVREAFYQDLKALKSDYVSTVMVHAASDLLRPGSDLLFNFLLSVRHMGICDKIGVSVCEPFEIERITSRYNIDVCSFPMNVFDQRFNRNLLERLKDGGLELHARSIFLHGGLLLMKFKDIPMRIRSLVKFSKFTALKGFKRSPISYPLNYLWQNELIDYGVIGVDSARQLTDILYVYRGIKIPINFSEFADNNPDIINPSSWDL